MGKVRLKIDPLLAGVLKAPDSDWLIIDREVEDGTTIGKFLAGLASVYTGFRQVIFDPDGGGLSNQVLVVLNGSLLQVPDVTGVKLKDGDTILLFTVDSGG